MPDLTHQLTHLLELAEAATPGPWATSVSDLGGEGIIIAAVARRQCVYAPLGGSFPLNDRRFIAAARNTNAALARFALAMQEWETDPSAMVRPAEILATLASEIRAALGDEEVT